MSIFLEFAETIEEELFAGRISANDAKTQLAINYEIAYGMELVKIDMNVKKNFAYTKFDKERDEALDARFCGREVGRSN